MMYFNKDNPVFSIQAKANNIKHLTLTIIECNSQKMVWEQAAADNLGQINYTINNLAPGSIYSIYTDGNLLQKIKSSNKGSLMFNAKNDLKKIEIGL